MTRTKFYKGWLYTGDMGTWDEDEFITVSGRKGRHDRLGGREHLSRPD